MKKIISLLLAVLMVVTVFAGCSGSNSDPATQNQPKTDQGSEKTDPGSGNKTSEYDPSKVVPEGKANFIVPESGFNTSEPVTIKFYHTMGSNLRDVLELYIEEFAKIYPNITVEHEQIGGYDDLRSNISTELTVGNQPSLAYNYPDHVALYNMTGLVAQLDDIIDSKIEVTRADGSKEIIGLTDEQKADFISGYYDEGKCFGDGFMYSLPFSKSTEVLYYNKTFFDEHQLTVPKTWDEMEALCRRIKEIDPDSIPLGYDSEANWFITMCEQHNSPYTSATGNHYLFENDTNKKFVKQFRSWYQSGLLTTQELFGAYTSGLFVGDTKDEKTGKVIRSYMSIGSSAGATHQRPAKSGNDYPFEVGITTIPQVDHTSPKVISQGPSVCVFLRRDSKGNVTNSQEVLASWLFIKYLTTNVEFQAEFSMASGYVPVISSVARNEFYSKFLENADGKEYIAALSAKVCLDQKNAYFVSPAFNGSSVARDQVGKLLSACISETTSDEDALIDEVFEEAIYECNYNN